MVIPSRADIPRYHELKIEIERMVGEINGQFTTGGWVPIHYMFRSVEHEELLALYKTSEIALITPLKDGMNLVAKGVLRVQFGREWRAHPESVRGGRRLSSSAGRYWLTPFDVEQTADAIRQACFMDEEERRTRIAQDAPDRPGSQKHFLVGRLVHARGNRQGPERLSGLDGNTSPRRNRRLRKRSLPGRPGPKNQESNRHLSSSSCTIRESVPRSLHRVAKFFRWRFSCAK